MQRALTVALGGARRRISSSIVPSNAVGPPCTTIVASVPPEVAAGMERLGGRIEASNGHTQTLLNILAAGFATALGLVAVYFKELLEDVRQRQERLEILLHRIDATLPSQRQGGRPSASS